MKNARALSITAASAVLALAAALVSPAAARPHHGAPGAPGAGDPYFPLDGNGGYDVSHYDLALQYDPDSGFLVGKATIRARATQDLSRFDLDFVGLDVHRSASTGSARDGRGSGRSSGSGHDSHCRSTRTSSCA